MTDQAIHSQIEKLIRDHRVVLFMKGNKHFPQCGFSAQVVQILKRSGVAFETVNVLSDPAMRDGIKAFSNWPTIPQLYIAGEFIGGCDIVRELHASGELEAKLGVAPAQVATPTVTIDDAAAAAIRSADEGNGDLLHLDIDESFHYEFYFGPAEPGDVEVVANGIRLTLSRESAGRANGLFISWVKTGDGGAFRMDNPNEPPRVRGVSAREVKAWIDGGKPFEMFDVRTDEERKVASVAQARALDDAGIRHLGSLDKGTAIVFMCHHGSRSRAAAERAVAEGFRQVYNLEGGIDAWSVEVDSTVARY
jgi:monothiol glutaredoxin